MPVHEFMCESCGTVEEHFYHVTPAEDPPCPVCLGPRIRLASAFKVVFTGPLTARYNDPKREGAHMEGFWDYRVRSSVSGNPEPVYLSTWDELREFRKSEHLSMPGDVPTQATMSADGRKISSAGMPGSWGGLSCLDTVPSGVWDMNTSLTSVHGKDADLAADPQMQVTGGTAPPAEGMG